MKKVTVKQHTRKSKSGKLSIVKTHLETIKKTSDTRISDVKKFVLKTIKNANSELDKFKGKTVSNSLKLHIDNKIKNDIIKYVIKETKNKNAVKEQSNKLFAKISGLVNPLYKSKSIKLIDKTKQSTSKFAFGYLGNGEASDNMKDKVQPGYTYYNQQIDKNEIWSKTIKRPNLEFIQIGKQLEKGKFSVKRGRIVKGKFVYDNLTLTKEQTVMLLKKGK